jgi:hypothetical protein
MKNVDLNIAINDFASKNVRQSYLLREVSIHNLCNLKYY